MHVCTHVCTHVYTHVYTQVLMFRMCQGLVRNGYYEQACV